MNNNPILLRDLKLKILFINVSKNWNGRVYAEYPIGVGILGTIALEAGHDVRILDLAVENVDAVNVIGEFKPDVTAISFLSTSATTAFNLIKQLNMVDCGTIVSGGIHTSIFPQDMVLRGVDFSLSGEGELSFIPLVNYITKNGLNKDLYAELAEIPSISYMNSLGVVVSTPASKLSVDLNNTPAINRDIFNLDLYPHHTIITSRGCPYKCKFCCSWGPGGKKGRMASPEKILCEVEMLAEKYGEISLYWADDMFFFNRRDRLKFCRMLSEKNLPIKWIAQLRADSIDVELAQALVEAGCVKICIGAESGSDRVLNDIGKKTKIEDIKKAIKICRTVGLRIKTWWITGLPGSSLEEEYAALDAITHSMPNEVAIHTFVPLPGTEYWDRASEFGIHLPSMDQLEKLFYYGLPGDIKLDYISPSDMTEVLQTFNTELRSLGYVATDEATDSSEFVFTSPIQDKTFNI
ncbi:radical SAM protein [Photobacterium iliopiscarium]|nr:radical SAM protein [Photobacterium iliopiscarium]PSV82297.1 radical SAM protein [Photobacterium iliopiscarium]